MKIHTMKNKKDFDLMEQSVEVTYRESGLSFLGTNVN